MVFKILEFGSKEAADKLVASAEKAEKTAGILEAIVSAMLTAESSFIHSGGRRGGGSWAQLKPSTVKKKGTTEILYTGSALPGYSKFGSDTMVKSLTERNAPFQILTLTNSTIEFGTDAPFAGVVNEKRPLIKFTNRDLTNWQEIFLNHVMSPFL